MQNKMSNNTIKWRQSIDQLSDEIEVNSRIALEKNQSVLLSDFSESQWLEFWSNSKLENTWHDMVIKYE